MLLRRQGSKQPIYNSGGRLLRHLCLPCIAVAQVHTHLMSINDQFTKKEQDKLQEALDKALKGAPKIVAGM